MTTPEAEEKLAFRADTAELMDIVTNAFYSKDEIFIRELISNASDACDKLRYEAITTPSLLADEVDLWVKIEADRKKKTLTITDNGVGMTRNELVENLGTIARSGTKNFVKNVPKDACKDVSQIGQFGVGFYSAFMVASHIDVISSRAGSQESWKWSSEGQGEFTVTPTESVHRGTQIILHLKDSAEEFLDEWRLRNVVKTYSDHIALPVILVNAGKDDEKGEPGKDETLNTASAVWLRTPSDVTEDQYKEFYRHISHAFDEPWLTTHYRAEGTIEYAGLLFVPSQKPMSLFQPDQQQNIKLYVNRVFISDTCKDVLPSWLRFVRGVVDSSDLPLNVSREMLQHNPVLAKIRTGLVKRLISDFKKKSQDQEAWAAFWGNFGAVVKEGLYEDFDDILDIVRFHSTHGERLTSLAEYVERMKDGQEAIYFLTGPSLDLLKRSPQIEGYRARGLEVLLLTDPIDEFWTGVVSSFKDKPFRSAVSSASDLDKIEPTESSDSEQTPEVPDDKLDGLITQLKEVLKDKVKDVRPSSRLTSSACCLAAEEGQMSPHLKRLMRQQNGPQNEDTADRVLEINPKHSLIRSLAILAHGETREDLCNAAYLLLDQARVIEGDLPTDPIAFSERMTRMMERCIT